MGGIALLIRFVLSMYASLHHATKMLSRRREVLFFAIGFLIGATSVYGLLQVLSGSIQYEANAESTHHGTVLERSLPVRLRIPEIGIDAAFGTPLGLGENGEVAVPKNFEQVGWYRYGPTPGELGPSVIFGHVDSFEGPAVFYPLGQLEEGDVVFIDREDGTTATFRVTGMERSAQENFPADRVYGNISHAGLRLITCTGRYDRSEARYSHNLIVYAELVE